MTVPMAAPAPSPSPPHGSDPVSPPGALRPPGGQGEPPSVIDLTDDVPEVLREGAGDISLL